MATARRKPTTRRRKPVKRTSQVRKPRATTRGQKLATWAATKIGEASEKHTSTVMSRKDAAILRMTHEGCARCKGNGQIFTKGKDGSFTGSKPCPAKPTRAKAGRMRVAIAARFGSDKRTGLVGWTCPCGSKEKPRFRDAREATKALRTHERKKHGGKSVGGAWYGQVPEGATEVTDQKKPAPKKKAAAQNGPTVASRTVRAPTSPHDPNDPTQEHRRGPVNPDPSVRNPHSGLTDTEWVAQGCDRPLEKGGCPECRSTTFLPVVNANAKTDYDRQIFIRCTSCVAGRVTA
ncbi:hypothetical protein ACFWDI_28270 [Streptomyces sp. NPDC060064]|uniref:hypothetical protein n=1 Tax=Streptomyces sp. NPDC060064 TaxID=3347049 RepID=UPI0036C14105